MHEESLIMRNINRYFKVIDNSLFLTTGKLDYDRVTDAIIALANYIYEHDINDEFMWDIGEGGVCTLGDLIVGAYWHYSEHHLGMNSDGYAAFCALGQVFGPGMSSVEEENEAYMHLKEMAEPPEELPVCSECGNLCGECGCYW